MLWTLAFDHRSSFRAQFLGRRGALSARDEAQARRLKTLALEALLLAADLGLPGGTPALLIDEEYGAELVGRARAAGLTVVVPVEKSGQEELAFEHGDDGFASAIEHIDPTYVKVLVRYNPWSAPTVNARQRARLGRLQAWLDTTGRDWMLELLVPPSSSERTAARFDPERWDLEVRPFRTVEAIGELVAAGAHPAYWKLEGLPSTEAYEEVAEATLSSGRPETACLVLGRGESPAAVDRWLRLAAPLPTYRGFAVGRTLWWEPLRAAWTGACPERVAVESIAANYRRLVDVYLAARRLDGPGAQGPGGRSG